MPPIPDMPHVIAYGSLRRGFTFVGPFATYDSAIAYLLTDAYLLTEQRRDDIAIIPLYEPDHSEEGRGVALT